MDENVVEYSLDDMNITTCFRENDIGVEGEGDALKFLVKKSPSLALERYYLERREDASELFRLGAFPKHVEKKNPSGFRNNVKS